MEYVQMTLTDWMEVKQRLKLELQGVKQSFVRIGYLLRKIDDQKAYESDGYKSIAEFAKAEYGLEASTVSRFMSINREYSIDGYSEHLREEYLDMGRSQLEEMLKLPDKDREMIQPEASREDIRELKRFNKSEPAAGVADDIQKLIEKFYEENPVILNEIFNGEEKMIDQRIEIVNPSGNRSFKKGLFFLMMYEDNIKIKKFGADPQSMSWPEFFEITNMIFGQAADGPNTWRNYFGKDKGDIELEDITGNAGCISEAATQSGESCNSDTVGCDRGTGGNTGKNESMPVGERTGSRSNGTADAASSGNEGTGTDEIEHFQRDADVDSCKEDKQESKREENDPETAKKRIAPAQKTEETPGNASVLETPEELPGQMEITKDFPEYCPETVNACMNSPCMTRKDYLDTLTPYGMAEYLAEKYKKQSLNAQLMESVQELETWLMQEVDENGRRIEEIQ